MHNLEVAFYDQLRLLLSIDQVDRTERCVVLSFVFILTVRRIRVR